MTESERAEQNVRGPRRRWRVNLAMVAALVLAMAALFVVLHDQQRRTENAEAEKVSLAQEVQAACEAQGSLDLDGRDLCQQADDVVDGAPATGPAGTDGVDGRDGVDGSDGTDGLDGKDGRDGKDGKSGLPGQDGADGTDGTDGANGAPATPVDGKDGTDGLDGTNGTDGKDGRDGTDGAPGAPGRGIAKVECHSTGDWIITYTDGTAGTADGPCRVAQSAPSPTATTTKGR